jgi:hypothetical protein
LEGHPVRYLVLSADYLEPRLRDDSRDDDANSWRVLSLELQADLARWNRDYQVVVPMDLAQRTQAADLIQELDTRGLQLARRISLEVGPSKVRYYSEGLMRYRP